MSAERPVQDSFGLGRSSSRFGRFVLPFFKEERAPAAQIVFHGYAEYADRYSELAAVLGYAGKKAPDDEVPLIQGLMKRRPPREGSLNLADTLFLAAMTSILAPARVIEVGTGTGFSSALIATMLRPVAGRQCVETIDANEHYRGDEGMNTGGDLAALLPDLPSAVRVHSPRQSDFVDQLAEPNEIEFGFIDANHRHPSPLLDLLRLARVTRPGGWIALHDIALGSLVAAAEREGRSLPFGGQFGAEWLFQAWPFPKVASRNSGAIQLPPRKREIRRVVKSLLKLPFEIGSKGHGRIRQEIAAALRAMSVAS